MGVLFVLSDGSAQIRHMAPMAPAQLSPECTLLDDFCSRIERPEPLRSRSDHRRVPSSRFASASASSFPVRLGSTAVGQTMGRGGGGGPRRISVKGCESALLQLSQAIAEK